MGRVLIVGHRGTMGHAPENTMASFNLALEMGADVIELDIQMSKDGELVVMHDPEVERTTNGVGRVCNLTLEELKRLDAGMKFSAKYIGERVPTLDEVLGWARGRTLLAVEIKGAPVPSPGIESKLVDMLAQHHMTDSVVVISFHHSAVKEVKELDSRIATGILVLGDLRDAVDAARQARAEAVYANYEYLTPEQVWEIHSAGLSLSAWAIDDTATMERFIRMGVDSIATNYPDRLHSLLYGLH